MWRPFRRGGMGRLLRPVGVTGVISAGVALGGAVAYGVIWDRMPQVHYEPKKARVVYLYAIVGREVVPDPRVARELQQRLFAYGPDVGCWGSGCGRHRAVSDLQKRLADGVSGFDGPVGVGGSFQGKGLADERLDLTGRSLREGLAGEPGALRGPELHSVDPRDGDSSLLRIVRVDGGEAAARRAMSGESPAMCRHLIGGSADLAADPIKDDTGSRPAGDGEDLLGPVRFRVVDGCISPEITGQR